VIKKTTVGKHVLLAGIAPVATSHTLTSHTNLLKPKHWYCVLIVAEAISVPLATA
jgi:hypothetical protein